PEDRDRVEVRGLAAGLDAPRLRLVHGGDRLDPDAGGVLQGVDGALEGLQAVAQVGAEGDHGPFGVLAGAVGGVALFDDGGGDGLDGRVGVAGGGRPGHTRLRVMVTVTSSKGTVIGASGLWTHTSTSCTTSCFRQTWAMCSASVSMRLTGSPWTTATTSSATMP